MFKKMIGLAALGGFLYAHKKRGGTLTLDSFKQTARGLFDDAKTKARELKSDAEQKLHETRVAGAEDFEPASKASSFGQDTGYGSSGYDFDDDRRRH